MSSWPRDRVSLKRVFPRCRWVRLSVLCRCSTLFSEAAAHRRPTAPSRRRSGSADSAGAWYSLWPPAGSPPCSVVSPRAPGGDGRGAARNLRWRSAHGAAPSRSFCGWTPARRSIHTGRWPRGRGNRRTVCRATSGRRARAPGRRQGERAVRVESHHCSARRRFPLRSHEEPKRDTEYDPLNSLWKLNKCIKEFFSNQPHRFCNVEENARNSVMVLWELSKVAPSLRTQLPRF